MRSKQMLGTIVLVSMLMMTLMSGPAYAITNGQPDTNDNWPYIGLAVFDVVVDGVQVPAWRCTGSLIAPDVVLTAGHCTDGAVGARIWFDWNVQDDLPPDGHYPWPGPDAAEAKEVHTHPDFDFLVGNGLPGFVTHDVGILILEEPISMGEYGELPEADLVDSLKVMTEVDLVGYGVQWQERPVGEQGPREAWRGDRTRYFAPAELITSNHVLSDEFVRVTANPAKGKGGTAFGDSGGPVLLGGTNTILAVNSFVTNANCKGVTYSSRVDTTNVLEWIVEFL